MKKYKQILKNQKGFTLIEILIVIAIIAILFIVLLPQIDNAQKRAREAGVKTDFHTVQTAAESYLREMGGEKLIVDGLNTFLDPSMKATIASNTLAKKDPWGQNYIFDAYEDKTNKNAAVIIIKSKGPNEAVGGGDDYLYAAYYYQSQIGSCTTGFDTNNIVTDLLTVGADGTNKADCGVNMPPSGGTTAANSLTVFPQTY